MDYGRDHLPEVVESAAGQFAFDRDSMARYFSLLRYDFTGEYQRGLLRFYELAHQAGELEEVPHLRFIDEYAGFALPAVLDDTDPGAALPEDLL
jgi:hypothetical protein